ncbi:MAG: hypothetical protein IKZ54_09430 [Bacteroidales bacterium]|nr:hypothetical protein [Bacteroidales bacterium]
MGNYAYNNNSNPYAVTKLIPENGQESLFENQTATYTGFDKLRSLEQYNKRLVVDYGIDRQRVRQTFRRGSSTRTKRHFTPLYESITENGVTKNLHYLTAGTGLFAIFATQTNGTSAMHYTLKDHQGSLAATVGGDAVERLSYDAWGRRRNPNGFGYNNVTTTFDRGYTLHEHYDGFNLINMNGRMYDPVIGRMLSPDIAIQDEYNLQAYNRYSYCFNNPLRFTDPSGYFVENPPYHFMLLNPNKILLNYYYGVEPSTVEYNTNESEGTQRINVKWKYDGDDYEANWVHQNLEGYYQTNKYGCLAIDMVAQERRFPYGNMDITEESMLGLFPNDKGIPAYKGWMEFEKLTKVFHNWNDNSDIAITALEDPFVSKFENKYGSVEQYTFDAMNKGEGITYHYFTDDPNMNHAINAYQAVKYFDGNKGKTTYDIRMWNPDPNIGGSKPFTRYRLNKIHTLKLKLR